ncbi:MAG: NAD-dependent epimerase/dehydratase family protein [Gammaproteobacteria bacterium]|nr:NAD-dependent epimerase/dehydratase family protein [Gammaproteobacteria bacterium]
MTKNSTNTVVIAGFGYLGQFIGETLLTQGTRVVALRRAAQTLKPCASFRHYSVDFDVTISTLPLPDTHFDVIYLVPPNTKNNTKNDTENHNKDTRLTRFLCALRQKPQRLIYISTTGIYGDCQGEWVNESRKHNPTTGRAKKRLAAEGQVTSYCKAHQINAIILRVAGIYGPGRLPLQRIIEAKPVLCAEDASFSNRIHVEDLRDICIAALSSNTKQLLLNVADGAPCSITDYIYRVADLAKLKRPPCVKRADAEKSFSASMLSYLNESRKIDNSKLLKTLAITLRHSDLSSGIMHSLAGENKSPITK